jgi:hypothetical protein
MLHRSISTVEPPVASRIPPPISFSWVEIGGAEPGGNARWATWIALLGGKDALYRTLVVANGSASVVIELQAQHPPVTQTLHRGGCRLPPETGDDGPIQRLLDVADEAARTVLVTPDRRNGPRSAKATHAATAPGERPALFRPPSVEDASPLSSAP